MLYRLRKAAQMEGSGGAFSGPVEVDETYVGGKRKNMSNAKRKELAEVGRGPAGKVAVIGAKDRATKQVSAKAVETTDAQMLKRGYVGIYHKMSPKHPDRYVQEFVRRYNDREADTVEHMGELGDGMCGKRLRYQELIADNGLDSGART